MMFLQQILAGLKKQLSLNSDKNIFYNKSDNFFDLSDVTKEFIIGNKKEIIDFFELNINKLNQPVLDIGCGYNSLLVKHLRDSGIESYGIDVLLNDKDEYLISDSWLEFDYSIEIWGTIISHMAFSNHLINNLKRSDGNYRRYVEKFSKILDSLKQGGIFYYAPSIDLKNIDFDRDKFKVSNDFFYYKNLKISKSNIIKN